MVNSLLCRLIPTVAHLHIDRRSVLHHDCMSIYTSIVHRCTSYACCCHAGHPIAERAEARQLGRQPGEPDQVCIRGSVGHSQAANRSERPLTYASTCFSACTLEIFKQLYPPLTSLVHIHHPRLTCHSRGSAEAITWGTPGTHLAACPGPTVDQHAQLSVYIL